ncbi:hypothetical protein M5K25_021423 [Dendrobium thyrsiflorum]|uniref:HMA domain-containing protein n=1 Tax=Dendrobium thyrsiflorum TaxID=117978 RepID=A0ABD0UCA1_DENTH
MTPIGRFTDIEWDSALSFPPYLNAQVQALNCRELRSFDMAETVVLKVGMSCQGCVGAVKRVLSKLEGVESFDVDLKEQKVTVKGNVKPEAVLQTVSKTGKTTSFWEAESEAKEADFNTAATATA